MNVILVALLVSNLALLFVFLSFVVYMRQIYRHLVDWWAWFSTQPDKDTPAPWQKQVSIIGQDFSRSLVSMAKIEFQNTASGIQSGAVRAEKAQKLSITQALIQGVLGAIGGKLGSSILPALMPQVPKDGEVVGSASNDFGRF